MVHTVNVLYVAFKISGVFFLDFLILSGFDFVVDLYPLIQTFINGHLAVCLIWQRDSTAKGAKKIHHQM